MATVWVADDLAKRRRVAVKILRQDLACQPEVVRRFMTEAKVIARVRSPHVPRVFEQGKLTDGTPYMTMEIMQGDDLDAYLRARGPLSLRATARLVSQVAAALEAAHRVGVVHRDVKAENIFIKGEEGNLEAKLFDFGIARMPSDQRQTQMGVIMGTPGYMSPEQLESAKEVDHRADFWALGVVAYVALTGKLPFDGETFAAMCIAVHHGVYDLPSHLRPELPREIDAWFARALNPDPRVRFQTASELSASLVAIVLGDRGAAGPEGDMLAGPAHPSGRHSVVGLSRTGHVAHESRRGAYLALAAAAAALLVYSTSLARPGSWFSSHAAAALAAPIELPAPAPHAHSPRLLTTSAPSPLPLAEPIVCAAPSAAPAAPASQTPAPRRHDRLGEGVCVRR